VRFSVLERPAVALVTVGAIGARVIESAEAMPITPASELERPPSGRVAAMVELDVCHFHGHRRAAAALLSPAPTHRTMASRPFGVRQAFLWLFIWSLRGTLKLRNFSFLGSDKMDNLLKAHS
jgi:hypothetical protein